MSISMTIAVNGTPVGAVPGIPFTAGMNVQQAMEAAYGISPGPVDSFMIQYFGQALGYEVTQLDGVSNQVSPSATVYLFWALSVNGRFSSTGIDSTVLSDGDEIEWNYTVFDPGTHVGTRHEEIRGILGATSGGAAAATAHVP